MTKWLQMYFLILNTSMTTVVKVTYITWKMDSSGVGYMFILIISNFKKSVQPIEDLALIIIHNVVIKNKRFIKEP